MTDPSQTSPLPWPLFLVMATSVFSALVWGLATFFRPRPVLPPRGPADPGDEPRDETTLPGGLPPGG